MAFLVLTFYITAYVLCGICQFIPELPWERSIKRHLTLWGPSQFPMTAEIQIPKEFTLDLALADDRLPTVTP